MAQAQAIPLTESEIKDFTDNYFGYFSQWWMTEGTGQYIFWPEAGAYVLIFKKTDGKFLYSFTPQDYSKTDPSATQYVIDETLKAIGDNTKQVFTGIADIPKFTAPSLKWATFLGIVILIYMTKDIWEPLLKNVAGNLKK